MLQAICVDSVMETDLRRLWSASLNLLPLSFSPLAVTHSWLRKRFDRDAEEIKKSVERQRRWLKRDSRNETRPVTDPSAPWRQQGFLLSPTQWTEAGRDTKLCWDSVRCCGSSACTQSCACAKESKHLFPIKQRLTVLNNASLSGRRKSTISFSLTFKNKECLYLHSLHKLVQGQLVTSLL